MKNFTYLLLLLMSVLFTACTAEEMDLGDEALLNDDLYLDCCMDLGKSRSNQLGRRKGSFQTNVPKSIWAASKGSSSRA